MYGLFYDGDQGLVAYFYGQWISIDIVVEFSACKDHRQQLFFNLSLPGIHVN